MGWCGGSEVVCDIARAMKKKKFSDQDRRRFYEVLIPALESQDWDNQYEVLGDDPVLDDVMKKLHPKWDWE